MIPPPEADEEIGKEDADPLAGSFLVAEAIAPPAIEAPPRIAPVGAMNGLEDSRALATDLASEVAVDAPAADDPAGLALVDDNAADRAEPKAPPIRADFIVVPRYVIYTQGALLAAVALTAFVIGVLLGRTLTQRNHIRRAPVRGQRSVTHRRPADGPTAAVIVLIPVSAQAAGERAVSGLRPAIRPAAEPGGVE
jgi:hypothetical protein